MRFSMNSYLLGVGTVVGALAFGFGGGILLTKTAIKDTPAGPSRMERAARPEPVSPQVQVTETKAVPVPRAEPSAVQPAPAEPVRQIQDSQVQAGAQPRPVDDVKPVAEPPRQEPKAAEPIRQIDTSKQAEQPVQQADAPKQVEQPPRQLEAKQVEQKNPSRAQPSASSAGRNSAGSSARSALPSANARPERQSLSGVSGRWKSRTSRRGPNSPSNAKSRGPTCLKACSAGLRAGSERAFDGAVHSVIAMSEATNNPALLVALDCFASLAMTGNLRATRKICATCCYDVRS